MSTPFLGQILMTGFNFAPRGFALCAGQLLSISQNQALFAILGTTYGGDGISTFGLPNLQGRVPLHFNGNNFVLGQSAGEQNHTLSLAEVPAHTHTPAANAAPASSGVTTGNLWATETANSYAPNSNGAMSPAAIGIAGGGQPHSNQQPFLVINFIIALQGIFPSRN